MGVKCHIQQYFSYIVAINLDGEDQNNRRKPLTCKSLTNFVTCCIEYTSPERDWNSQHEEGRTIVVIVIIL